jgi:hypothetical protein
LQLPPLPLVWSAVSVSLTYVSVQADGRASPRNHS